MTPIGWFHAWRLARKAMTFGRVIDVIGAVWSSLEIWSWIKRRRDAKRAAKSKRRRK